MMMPGKACATCIASADLPLAVGPPMTITGRFALSLSEIAASDISDCMMKSVLTLVAPPDRHPLSDAVTTVLLQRLRQVGATTDEIVWLQEAIACDIPFDNLPVDQA